MPQRPRTRLRWLVWSAVGLAVAAVVAGSYLTSPSRLKRETLSALHRLGLEGADVAAVTFSPWCGLEVNDLTVIPLAELPIYRRPGRGRNPPLLHIGSAKLSCHPLALLGGRLRPTAIELRDVAIALVCDPGRTAEESQPPEQHKPTDSPGILDLVLQAAQTPLPHLVVSQGDFQLMVVEQGRPRLVRRWLLRAEGQAEPGGYTLRIDPRPPGDDALGEISWDRNSGELRATLGWVDLDTIGRVAPAKVAGLLRRLRLLGRARLEQLVFRVDRADQQGRASQGRGTTGMLSRLTAARARLVDGGFVVPLEEETGEPGCHATPPKDCFLQVTDATATLAYAADHAADQAELTIKILGRVRDAPAEFSLTARPEALRRLAEPKQEAGAWPRPEHDAKSAFPSARPDRALGLNDILEAELRVQGLELPTLETYPTFIRSPRLRGPIAAAFEHYRPRGRINLHVRVLPLRAPGEGATAETGANRIEAEIEACGVAGRYYLFPYDFEDATGLVRLARGRIELHNLCGRHGITRIWADGVVNSSHSWTGLDLSFQAQNVALDRDLYAAIPGSYHPLWQRAQPLGVCDALVTVQRPDGSAERGPPPSRVRVDAQLLAGSLGLPDGRRLEQADGWFTIQGGTIRICNLHGYYEQAGLRLDGGIPARVGTAQTDVRVAISDLPVDSRAALSPTSADLTLHLAGRADAWGQVRTAESARTGRHVVAHLKHAELCGLDPARTWAISDGWVKLDESGTHVSSLVCRQGQARLEMVGTLPPADDPRTPPNFEIRAITPAVEELYPQFMGGDWAALAHGLGLAGRGEVTVRLRSAQRDAGADVPAADVALRVERMRPRWLPLDLHQVSAELALAPGRFQIRQAIAHYGQRTQIIVRQPLEGTWEDEQVQAEFSVAAQRLTCEPELIAALPRPLAEVLQNLAAAGQFDVFLPSVAVRGGRQRTWRVEGRVPVRDAALRLGLDLRVVTGELVGQCLIAPEREIQLDAQFQIDQGQLAGRPIQRWDGQLRREAGDRWVRLENVHGRLCDGFVQGFLRIDPETADYELSLRLHDVSIAQLLPPKDQPQRPRPGRIHGQIWLRGRGQDPSTRRGGGSLRISGASFLQTPVLAAVLAQHDQPGISDRVDRADLRFVWDGQLLRLERVEIHSRDLRLVGEGTWSLPDDTVRMTLWAAHPEYWPRVAVISDFLESAGQELVQYRVEGTLSAPKVTAEPLYKLNETLRRLLGSEE